MTQKDEGKRAKWLQSSWVNRDSKLWEKWRHPVVLVPWSRYQKELDNRSKWCTISSGGWAMAEQTWAIGHELA